MERSMSVGSFGSLADQHAIIHPAMDHPSRKTSRSSSVFSLVATLVGGGCLSLPYAFQQTGVVEGVVYLVVSGLLSGYSMRLLLSSSRRTGAQTYEECGEKAFGVKMKFATMALLTAMTFLASIAYLILARDLATPLVETLILDGKNTSKTSQNLIALICAAPIVPFCFAKDLHSLRFTSLISLVALAVLSVAILYRCIDHAGERPIKMDDLKFASFRVQDTLYAFPFMQLSFMAHFNMLPIHVGLRKPTRRRLDQVVSFTILFAMVFYLFVSLSGYLFAFDQPGGVPENILKAFDRNDVLINVGRAGFLLTILLSFPLLILPCRETLLRLLHEMSGNSRSRMRVMSSSTDDAHSSYVRLNDNDNEAATVPGNAQEPPVHSQDVVFLEPGENECDEEEANLTIINTPESPEFRTPHLRMQERRLEARMHERFDLCSREGLEHVISTSVILFLSMISMCFIPGVAAIWDLTGSTVGMLLAFVFPSAFYIKIRSPEGFWHPHDKDARFLSAWALFVFSILATVVCTVESVRHLLSE